MDYQPIDLTTHCNAGPDLCAPRTPRTGEQLLRGLPFKIGAGDGPCFLAFGPEPPCRCQTLAIPVGQAVRRLIFAHVLLEGPPPRGGPGGPGGARFRFVPAGGRRAEAPDPGGFGIGFNPPGLGELPFLAVPDRTDSL